MRVIIFLISFLFLENVKGQVFKNRLLLLKEDDIIIYDLSNRCNLLTIPLQSAEKWNIGKITKDEKVIKILLHNEIRFIGTNFNKQVNEKEIIISAKDLSVQSIKDRAIVQLDSGLFLVKEGERLNEMNLNERYLDRKYCFSEEGNLYLNKESGKVFFLSGSVENKVLCGYNQPDMSDDGKLIICEFNCSKYRGKKQLLESQIIEIEVETKKVNKIQLTGYSPTYSEDGRVILYKNGNGFNLYFKEIRDNIYLKGVFQAEWIK